MKTLEKFSLEMKMETYQMKLTTGGIAASTTTSQVYNSSEGGCSDIYITYTNDTNVEGETVVCTGESCTIKCP